MVSFLPNQAMLLSLLTPTNSADNIQPLLTLRTWAHTQKWKQDAHKPSRLPQVASKANTIHKNTWGNWGDYYCCSRQASCHATVKDARITARCISFSSLLCNFQEFSYFPT